MIPGQAVTVVVPEGLENLTSQWRQKNLWATKCGATREPITAETDGASTCTCQHSGGKKHESLAWDGTDGQIPQRHLGGPMETAEHLAVQDRELGQDIQGQHGSEH